MSFITQFFNNLMEKYLPDAFVFAILLTGLVFGLGIIFTPYSGFELIDFWGQNLWNLLKFSMEMALILVGGYVLAKTPLISFFIDKLTTIGNTQVKAVILATIVSSLACLINWGFGLIMAALISTELYRRNKKLNFGLLVASSYSGFLLWHGGLSGSIPLKLTSPSQSIQDLLGSTHISLGESVFGDMNLVLIFINFGCILLVNWLLARRESYDENLNIEAEETQVSENKRNENSSFSQKLEQSKLLSIIMSVFAMIFIYRYLSAGGSLNLGILSTIFIFLGLGLHHGSKNFIQHFSDGVKKSSGIILQFPLYAGIMGMMSMSGLSADVTSFFIEYSNDSTFYLMTYWSAGLLNFFVPSGGGQWALQAPIILPAAKELGLDLVKASMAVAWGDAWTNMIQPFWALPLLSISKLSLNSVMKYTVLIFLVSGVFSSLIFVIMSK